MSLLAKLHSIGAVLGIGTRAAASHVDEGVDVGAALVRSSGQARGGTALSMPTIFDDIGVRADVVIEPFGGPVSDDLAATLERLAEGARWNRTYPG